MVKLLSAFAPAKLNLFLRIVGRRDDGYHELDSLFVPITLGDRVAIEVRDGRPGAVSIRGKLGSAPADDRNLAVRAARAFVDEFGFEREIVIELDKSVPSGAGLGGGSSDAGAVLRMLAATARLPGLAPPTSSDRLIKIAATLGADVPFFLHPTPARVRGIGEKIVPVAFADDPPLVVAVPPIEAPTALVYRDLKPSDWSGRVADGALALLLAGDYRPDHLVNDLAKPAIARWPEIGRLKSRLERLKARAAAMTGSGAGVFAIFRTFDEASAAAAELRRLEPDARVFTATIWRQ
ncbi:4-(cytidine 5'-diphospho)-2-C-methyl-D-erythritol kinase [bacterium]|nr:4-(cytidine 5'-diphospho)-2-C-methyl-D-erythritol kinase [bacterium]